ncbi:MAG: YabP/YqfC family sporulation protein [Oscillospiraceae bacterium]|nr:YabP/YqfC family sporulation protein [Oscillospiraceae bacterium]
MKKRLRKISDSFEIPMGVISDYYMEIYSGNEIVLNGDAAVTELEDSVLKVKCGEHRIIFSGTGLKIEYYTSGGIKITGDFSGIEFG